MTSVVVVVVDLMSVFQANAAIDTTVIKMPKMTVDTRAIKIPKITFFMVVILYL